MSRIRVLPPHIANKIAAGEVVDRPASVVKELVENAIDAGADRITVVIQNAGKELIQVIDNGGGMTPEEAELAFERHATSKIADVADLDRIATLGFRGEALPSIASVARLEVKTCATGEPVGTVLRLEGGEIIHREPLALKAGTTISIKSLFYNTPARRNFLRSDTAEFTQILRWMKRFFLAQPDIHFTLIHNGEELYNLPAGDPERRIRNVFGDRLFEGLAPVQETVGDIALTGYVSRPEQTRGNRDNQYLYLNGRAIVNHRLAHAVAQGYGNLLERNRHPQFILFLAVPAHLVDVNVHPTKMEVRFANDRVMFHLFLSGTRQAIQSGGEGIPRLTLHRADEPARPVQMDFGGPPAGSTATPPPGPVRPPKPGEDQLQIDYRTVIAPPRKRAAQGFDRPADDGEEAPAGPRLWQVHRRYIFSQMKSGLVIIDQQAAHERVLFESVLETLENRGRLASQKLLFTQTVELPLEDYLVYKEIREQLAAVGFSISELSGRTVVIEAIPADVRVGREGRILLDVLDAYRDHEETRWEPVRKTAAAFAARNAVRAGDAMEEAAMAHLVDRLFRTREPNYSPRGRPVFITLDLEELERRFKRPR